MKQAIEEAILARELHVLPLAGGLYDQDPDWLAKTLTVWDIIRQVEEAKAKREQKHG